MSRITCMVTLAIGLMWLVPTRSVQSQQRFSELVGPTQSQPVAASKTIAVPYITWGGDVATFQANGGLTTAPKSTFDRLGLQVRLTPGDDFLQQVRDYMTGKSPFLRGTMRMLGQASEVLGASAATKPVVILQLSWSAGDHIVAREHIRTLNDLKGTKKVRIACQQGGPHVGLLYDSLEVANIKRDEIEIVWVSELTGDKGAAAAFRSDPSLDACCVITPDMVGLTGGIADSGSGAEGTVRGAHVINSTQQMSRSIADVYAVRSDWYEANRPLVDKFVAGYLNGSEAIVAMRREYETSQRLTPTYRTTLTLAQSIFGQDVLPTLEVDAHGLLLDCSFVGIAGQIAFFEDRGNLNGFEAKMKAALDMATQWGYARSRLGFSPPGLDYREVARTAGIQYEAPERTGGRILSQVELPANAEGTIVSFDIGFAMEQTDFSTDRYGTEFMRAVKAASTFGNAVVMIRGHSDTTQTIRQLVTAGKEKGTLVRRGTSPNFYYELNGKRVNIESPAVVIELIQSGAFEGTQAVPTLTLRQAERLSAARADAVRNSLIQFAQEQGVNLDVSQIQAVGVGIAEPIVAIPRNLDDAGRNRRVEFRIVRVPAEALKATDFDF